MLGGAAYGYGSQVIRNLNNGVCFWDALSLDISAQQVALYAGVGTLMGLGIGGGIQALSASTGIFSFLDAGGTNELIEATQAGGELISRVRYWPSPSQGRQIINGIEYSVHALQRMMPVSLGGRGIPPSVVENAILYGETLMGKTPNTVIKVYENVFVVWNFVEFRVVTVIKK